MRPQMPEPVDDQVAVADRRRDADDGGDGEPDHGGADPGEISGGTEWQIDDVHPMAGMDVETFDSAVLGGGFDATLPTDWV